MRISDWSSDVCSSDLVLAVLLQILELALGGLLVAGQQGCLQRLGVRLGGHQVRTDLPGLPAGPHAREDDHEQKPEEPQPRPLQHLEPNSCKNATASRGTGRPWTGRDVGSTQAPRA